MNPVDILKLVRDGIIVAALAFVVWWIRHDGVNSAKVGDLKALESQLADNALRQKQIAQEVSDAQAKHSRDMETVSAAIASHADQPIRLCVSARPGPVHGVSTTTPGQPAGSGRTDAPARGDSESTINVRNQIDEFERRFEGALADCREVVNSWPK